MAPKPEQTNEPAFEETTTMPRGRKARQIPKEVWEHLEASATRGVGFAKTAHPQVIDELRRDLGSAAVRAKYDVTTGTEKLDDAKHRLTFSARHKRPVAEASSSEAAAEPAS